MSSMRGMDVSAAVWKALPSAIRSQSAPNAADTLILAAYLDLASEKHGLSELYESEVADRLNRPTAFLPVVSHYLDVAENPIDPEDVRTALYSALLSVVDTSRSFVDGERDLQLAQVYWALSDAEGSRGRLPYRSDGRVSARASNGQSIELRSLIGSPEIQGDLGSMMRTPRTDSVSGHGLSSGSGLRSHGARLAVAAAMELIRTHHKSAHPTECANIDLEVREAGGKRRIEIVSDSSTPEHAATATNDDAARPAPISPLRDLHERAQKYEANSLHFQAGAVRSSMVQILSNYSESNPVDTEGAIASVGVSAGFSYLEADRPDLALLEFEQAIRIDELLSVLTNNDAAAVRLTSARTMVATIHQAASDFRSARQTLTDALHVAQDLADGNAAHEDLLVVVLIMSGTLDIQFNDLSRANLALTRACKVAKKIARRTAGSPEGTLLVSLSLLMLGLIYLLEDRLPAAESVLAEGIASLGALTLDGPADQSARVVIASLQAFLGTTYDRADRHVEASAAWLTAVENLDGIDGNGLVGRGARLIQLQSLSSLALASVGDDSELARGYAIRAVEIGRQLDRSQYAGDQVQHLLGMSLMLLTAASYDLGDLPTALASIAESVAVLDHAIDDGAVELLAQAREALDELLAEQQESERLMGPAILATDVGSRVEGNEQ